METPKRYYEHDGCRGCISLGNLRDGDKWYDLYYCPQNGIPTVIARFGNSPEQYMSGMNSATMNPLKVAKARAEARGFETKPFWR